MIYSNDITPELAFCFYEMLLGYTFYIFFGVIAFNFLAKY